MTTDRSLLRIIGKFNLDVRNRQQVKRGVYRLTTRTGKTHCLKRMSYPQARLVWMDRTLCALRQAGFRNIAWRNQQERVGKHLFVRDDHDGIPYILTPWLAGRLPSASSTKDMYAIAKTLARFHLTSQQITLTAYGMDNWLGKWPAYLQERTERLQRRIAKAKRRVKRSSSPTSMEQLLARHGDRLLHRAEKALTRLQRSDYRTLCKRAARCCTVCHGDSGPNNFVLTDRGPALIDFETLRVDLRVFDLYRMLRLAGKENGWDPAAGLAALDGYRSVSELAASEYDLLLVWLMFPHKAYRIVARYERADSEEERDQLARKLRRFLQEDAGLSTFLRAVHEYASKG